jgi:hypothetical protein
MISPSLFQSGTYNLRPSVWNAANSLSLVPRIVFLGVCSLLMFLSFWQRHLPIWATIHLPIPQYYHKPLDGCNTNLI